MSKSMADLFTEEEETALREHREREAAITPEQRKAMADAAAKRMEELAALPDEAGEDDEEDEDEEDEDPD